MFNKNAKNFKFLNYFFVQLNYCLIKIKELILSLYFNVSVFLNLIFIKEVENLNLLNASYWSYKIIKRDYYPLAQEANNGKVVIINIRNTFHLLSLLLKSLKFKTFFKKILAYKNFSKKNIISDETLFLYQRGLWDDFLKSKLKILTFIFKHEKNLIPNNVYQYEKFYEKVTSNTKPNYFNLYILFCLVKKNLISISSIQLGYEEAYLKPLAVKFNINYILLGHPNAYKYVLLNPKYSFNIEDKFFNEISKKVNLKKYEEQAIDSLNLRVLGKYDKTTLFWMKGNDLGQENKGFENHLKERIKFSLSKNKNIKKVFFLFHHCFTDAPNFAHDVVQKNYLDYFHATLSFLHENINDSLIFHKYHPGSFGLYKDTDKKFIESLERLSNLDSIYKNNLIKLPRSINIIKTRNLFDFFSKEYGLDPCLVSCRGSILVEAAYVEMRSMSLFDCLYSRLAIASKYNSGVFVNKEKAKQNSIFHESVLVMNDNLSLDN